VALCVFCGPKNGIKGYPQRNAAHVGEHCLSRQAVHNWVQKFSEGRTSIEDEHRAGRLVEIAKPETLQRGEDCSPNSSNVATPLRLPRTSRF